MTECTGFPAFNTAGKIVMVYCGRWSCERCAKRNARKWALRVKLHMTIAEDNAGNGAHKHFRFWTLTLGSKYRTASQAYADLPRLWDTFRKMVQRLYDGSTWAYCAFVEAHPKRGNIPHFHIISDLPVPHKKRWYTRKDGTRYQRTMRLKDFAVMAGFGYQAKDIEISEKKAANYMAKYASKGSAEIPKRFRRVRPSQNWTKLPPLTDKPKVLVKAAKETIYAYLWRVHEVSEVEMDDLLERWRDAISLTENIKSVQ